MTNQLNVEYDNCVTVLNEYFALTVPVFALIGTKLGFPALYPKVRIM